MKITAAFAATLMGFAAAAPVAEPQDIDFDAYNIVPIVPGVSAPVGVAPDPVVYNPSGAATSAAAAATGTVGADLSKRGSCDAQPAGNYATVSPDTPAAFLADPDFSTIANAAVTPPGYFLSEGFVDLQASASDSTYLTYVSSSLSSYDTDQCATLCTAIAGCVSFNICKFKPSCLEQRMLIHFRL